MSGFINLPISEEPLSQAESDAIKNAPILVYQLLMGGNELATELVKDGQFSEREWHDFVIAMMKVACNFYSDMARRRTRVRHFTLPEESR